MGLIYSLLAKGCNVYWSSSDQERAFVESAELFGVAWSQKEVLGNSVLHFQVRIRPPTRPPIGEVTNVRRHW